MPSGQPSRQDAERVALVWVDYSLLAQAAANGRSLSDSITVVAATEPDRLLLTLRAWHDTLQARRPPVPGGSVDSFLAGDRFRVFQHILIRVPERRDLPAVQAARRRADSLLAEVRGGADFGALARQRSEDPTAADDGFLPVARRGMLWPELERAAWDLAPGNVIGVSSRIGLHVVRRPPLDEARPRLRAWADTVAARRADSLHADSLVRTHGFAVTRHAVPELRRFFEDPATGGEGTTPLATWEGGSLFLREAVFWVDLLPPGSYISLRGGSDLSLMGFVRDIGLQRLLFEEARSSGVRLRADQIATLEEAYRRGLRESFALLGLNDVAAALGNAEASGRVAALLEGLAADRVRWRPLPSGLGALLRDEMGYRFHPAGLARAVEAAASP